jgi:hypothetical protein
MISDRESFLLRNEEEGNLYLERIKSARSILMIGVEKIPNHRNISLQ